MVGLKLLTENTICDNENLYLLPSGMKIGDVSTEYLLRELFVRSIRSGVPKRTSEEMEYCFVQWLKVYKDCGIAGYTHDNFSKLLYT